MSYIKALVATSSAEVILHATLLQPDTPMSPEGSSAWMLVALMALFMTLFTLFRSVACRVTQKFPDAPTVNDQNVAELTTIDSAQKDECRPPSPTPASTEADLLSRVMKMIGELEEKAVTLQAKPSEMPYEKEELLNASVCRVDALEAELIATKKALHEALMRQEELLAYIEGQAEAKFRKKKFCL